MSAIVLFVLCDVQYCRRLISLSSYTFGTDVCGVHTEMGNGATRSCGLEYSLLRYDGGISLRISYALSGTDMT
eukprot:3935586-Rhodomonas_salina.2